MGALCLRISHAIIIIFILHNGAIMVHIRTQHYNNGLNKPYSHSTMHYIYKCFNGAFTMKDARKYISEHSNYGIRGYLFENLKENGYVIWFTEPDFVAEYKYPDRGPCNA